MGRLLAGRIAPVLCWTLVACGSPASDNPVANVSAVDVAPPAQNLASASNGSIAAVAPAPPGSPSVRTVASAASHNAVAAVTTAAPPPPVRPPVKSEARAAKVPVPPQQSGEFVAQSGPAQAGAMQQADPVQVAALDVSPPVSPPAAPVSASPPPPPQQAALPKAAPEGQISGIGPQSLALYDDSARQISSIDKSQVTTPLAFYARKGMYLQTVINNQAVWVKETQVTLKDSRPPEPEALASKSPKTAVKSASPGLR